MLPLNLTAADPESDRRRFAVVRLDTCERVPGLILSASVETGQCMMRNEPSGEAKEYIFGPYGLRIVIAAWR